MTSYMLDVRHLAAQQHIASTDDVRPILCGVAMAATGATQITGSVTVQCVNLTAATDSYRLMFSTVTNPVIGEGPATITECSDVWSDAQKNNAIAILPGAAIKAITKAAKRRENRMARCVVIHDRGHDGIEWELYVEPEGGRPIHGEKMLECMTEGEFPRVSSFVSDEPAWKVTEQYTYNARYLAKLFEVAKSVSQHGDDKAIGNTGDQPDTRLAITMLGACSGEPTRPAWHVMGDGEGWQGFHLLMPIRQPKNQTNRWEPETPKAKAS